MAAGQGTPELKDAPADDPQRPAKPAEQPVPKQESQAEDLKREPEGDGRPEEAGASGKAAQPEQRSLQPKASSDINWASIQVVSCSAAPQGL